MLLVSISCAGPNTQKFRKFTLIYWFPEYSFYCSRFRLSIVVSDMGEIKINELALLSHNEQCPFLISKSHLY